MLSGSSFFCFLHLSIVSDARSCGRSRPTNEADQSGPRTSAASLRGSTLGRLRRFRPSCFKSPAFQAPSLFNRDNSFATPITMKHPFSPLVLLLALLHAGHIHGKCRNVPGSAEFPTAAAWRVLNTTISGRLVLAVPSAKYCASLPGGACTDAQWTSALFRSTIPGAMDQVCYSHISCFAAKEPRAGQS